MTWTDFQSTVNSLMPTDAARKNCSAIITLQTKAAVRHLQRLVDFYQRDHVTYYVPADGSATGYAMQFQYPDSSGEVVMPKEAWLVSDNDITCSYEYAGYELPDGETCDCERRPFTDYPWRHRSDMRCGALNLGGCKTLWIAWDPKGVSFLTYPAITDGYKIEFHWDGIYCGWDDDEETRLTEEEAPAIADYVRSEIRREVDRDEEAARNFERAFAMKVRRLNATAIRRVSQKLPQMAPLVARSCAEMPTPCCSTITLHEP